MKHLMVALISLLIVNHVSAGSDLLKELKDNESWLMVKSDACPADVMGADKNINYNADYCANKISKCLKECRQNSAYACYNLGQTLQDIDVPEIIKYYEALYLKSCKLGSVSGCTNRAAGMQLEIGNTNECSIRTFAKACQMNDPWACTMYGLHLTHGIGIERNLKKARRVLKKSCKFGEEDPACRSALKLVDEIDTLSKAKDHKDGQ